METQMRDCSLSSQRLTPTIDRGLLIAKEPVREIPDEPHDPEIQPDLPVIPLPDLSPEIPDDPSPEILPGHIAPEISPSPDF